jgi:hypothetical protein
MLKNVSRRYPTSAVNRVLKEEGRVDLDPPSQMNRSQSKSNGPSKSLLNKKKGAGPVQDLGPTRQRKGKNKRGPIVKIKRKNQSQPSSINPTVN